MSRTARFIFFSGIAYLTLCVPALAVLTEGLTFYSPLDAPTAEAPTTAIDLIRKHNGVISPEVTIFDDPTRGEVFDFSASGSASVIYPNLPIMGDGSRTISFWFNTLGTTGYEGVSEFMVSRGNSSSSDAGWSFWLNSSTDSPQARANIENAGVDQKVGTSYGNWSNDSNWHHMLMTIDNTAGHLTAYIDGVSSGIDGNANGWIAGGGGAASTVDFTPAYSGNIGDLMLGVMNASRTDRSFSGQLDDVAIWDRVLTESEIAEVYSGASLVPDPGPTSDSTVLVQISDPQFYFASSTIPSIPEAEYDQRVQAAIQYVNRLSPDGVVVTGDLIQSMGNETQVEAFWRLFNQIDPSIPVYYLPGNHDTSGSATSLEFYRENFGDDYYSFSMGQDRCLAINSMLLRNESGTTEEVELHWQWIESELAEAAEEDARHILIFSHHQLFAEDPDESDGYNNLPTTSRERLFDLFEEYGVDAVFAGHYHRNRVTQYQGVDYIITSSVSVPFDDEPAGFRIIQLNEDGITHQYVATPELIPGDANGDRKVDGSDVTILANNWQAGVDPSDTTIVTWAMGDFNGDGKVDGSDVTILANNWQTGVTAAAATVPEPNTLLLVLSAIAGLLTWKRASKL